MGGIPVTLVNNGTPVVATTRGVPVTLVDVHGNPEPVVPADGAIATDGQVIPVQG